jgi:uncharacterized protein DUF1707
VLREVPVAAGPWNSRARAHAHLRASDGDREQVVEILTAAFVQGRLNLDELTLRTGQALASRTYAELAAIIADIPAPPLRPPAPPRTARPPAPVRRPPPPPGRMPTSAKAVVWAACVIVAVPAVWAAFVTYYGGFLILFLLAFTGLTLTIGTTADRRATG